MEFWDSLAEIAGHHLKKGDQVYVVGKLTVDQFTTNGVVKKTVKVGSRFVMMFVIRS